MIQRDDAREQIDGRKRKEQKRIFRRFVVLDSCVNQLLSVRAAITRDYADVVEAITTRRNWLTRFVH